MNGEDLYPESSRSLDDLWQMRLLLLLGDMIDDLGKVKAAKTLGVNYRILDRVAEAGRLTERMSEALEDRLTTLEEELRGGLEVVVGEVKALREEHGRAMRHVERRLVRLEAGRDAQNAAETAAAAADKPVVKPRWRLHRELVTQEPEPGEEQVYGDATPMIVEWRRASAEFLKTLKTGTTLDRTEVQEWMLKLELAIVEEHELTLPPASHPWDGFDRRDQLWERRQGLNRVQVERNRALLRRWLRRVFTLGLWRN